MLKIDNFHASLPSIDQQESPKLSPGLVGPSFSDLLPQKQPVTKWKKIPNGQKYIPKFHTSETLYREETHPKIVVKELPRKKPKFPSKVPILIRPKSVPKVPIFRPNPTEAPIVKAKPLEAPIVIKKDNKGPKRGQHLPFLKPWSFDKRRPSLKKIHAQPLTRPIALDIPG